MTPKENANIADRVAPLSLILVKVSISVKFPFFIKSIVPIKKRLMPNKNSPRALLSLRCLTHLLHLQVSGWGMIRLFAIKSLYLKEASRIDGSIALEEGSTNRALLYWDSKVVRKKGDTCPLYRAKHRPRPVKAIG